MRIIDADRAKEIAEVSLGDIFLQTALKLLIDKVPTIDAVPVVRCKDCKFYDEGECIMMSEPENQRAYERWTVYMSENDFCSDGERKDND